jgi:signal transduction histidine kinase/ActR/RegA family two-component response regulator
MTSLNESSADERSSWLNSPPPWLVWGIALLAIALMAALRLYIFPTKVVALSYVLPLLLVLWTRDVRSLYAMSVAFTGISASKAFWLVPFGDDTVYEAITFAMQICNIWVAAVAIHFLLVVQEGLARQQKELVQTNRHLDAANAELTAANEELAAREEEILSQNEELQSQAEELEQQAEELRQQTEETEQQAAEVQDLNQELARREKGMQTLLESARWMRSELDERSVMDAVCQAAVQVIGDAAQAAAVLREEKGHLSIRGHAGFGITGAVQRSVEYGRSFSTLVAESGQTAALHDAAIRPDLELPQPSAGRPFRSAIGTPIWLEGQPVATLEVYSHQPREWTEEHFRVVEWLAAQTALAMQALQSQKELDVRRRDAEEASQQKTRFLAAVSHDVRTPTNAISLLADLIEITSHDAQDVAEIKQMASDLKSNAKALVELVSDVLDLTRFDSGRFEVESSEFSLSSLLESEVRVASPIAKAKGIDLRMHCEAEDVWLRTDRLKLGRIVGNLVGNAIKFTNVGEVAVVCERNPNDGVDLRVIDTGVGIPSENLARIFDEFFQLRNPERDRTKGTGLGLAICKRLADGLGCNISVTSVAGCGSTFTIHLPSELFVSPDPISQDGRTSCSDGDGRVAATLVGKNVLLIEDHDVTRKTVSQLLAAQGANVREARLGREGMRLIGEGTHDAIVLDLMLPDVDGTEILKLIRADRPARLKCVLVVSGDVRDARIDEAKRLGADDLLPKPLNIERLLGALQLHLRETKPATWVAGGPSAARAATPALPQRDDG